MFTTHYRIEGNIVVDDRIVRELYTNRCYLGDEHDFKPECIGIQDYYLMSVDGVLPVVYHDDFSSNKYDLKIHVSYHMGYARITDKKLWNKYKMMYPKHKFFVSDDTSKSVYDYFKGSEPCDI